jgi:hypothetical protein
MYMQIDKIIFPLIIFPTKFGDKNIDKIKSFSKLKDGWDFGSGLAINDEVINKAESAYFSLSMFFKISVHPTSEGGITISTHIDENFFDITIFPYSDFVEYTHEKGIGNSFELIEFVENLTLNEAINKAFDSQKIISSKCISLERLILENTTQKKRDSRAMSSNQMVGVFQYSIQNVQNPKAKQFAVTSTSSTNQPFQLL